MPIATFNSPVRFSTFSKRRSKLSPVIGYPDALPHPQHHHQHQLAHNRRLPALQLCSDVLEYIFLLAAEREYTTDNPRRTIISYSHICHDWRAIVLSLKRLWSRLVDFEEASCEWNLEMLRRSHPLPIRVSYNATLAPRNAQVLKLQMDCLDRIRSYTLCCPDTDWDLLVALLDSRPAPSLEKLSITCCRSFGAIGSRPALLPVSLFGGCAPNLRRLYLNECGIDFRAARFLRSLTSLQVVDLSYDIAPTALEWLDILQDMPKLTQLSLQGAILPSQYRPQRLARINGDQDGYTVPIITNLNLDGSLSDIAFVVDNLVMPPSCHWTLTCSDCIPGSSLDLLIDSLTKFIDDSTYIPAISTRHLSIAAQTSNIFLTSEIASPGSNKEAPVGFYINLRTRSHTQWDTLFPIVASGLSEIIPIITSLELALPIAHPSLLPLLRRASSLDMLMRLSGKLSKTLLPAFQSLTPTGGLLLPSLRSIVFTDDSLVWGESYRNLLSFLRWRSQMGAPIQRVFFLRCFVLEAVVKELNSLGVSVEGALEGLRWQNL
ncbi:hypothetical protein JR316_0010392 [Psilocybe cubensis]|uniref:Uncharacterized protein n=2 Tax=Psilocybe cubensis TaxID=181762 RepID=A0ACB8GN84_PSICU|nr:hypothetical protein JR316_0010392 [Psilocybe cubensis]KAH9476480.1 hypothetical protein JR316_0010392 [Psilocybe cubensis]